MDKLLSTIKAGTTVIYAHNFSGFDGIFLLRHLFNYGRVEPLLFNGKLISVKLIVTCKNKSKKTIIFKDSYLLLPLSLRKLCFAFKVESIKSYFPFLLNRIYYSGVLPKFEYWSGIDIAKYNEIKAKFKNKLWSFETEAKKYCLLDCVSLHQVLTKFNELIFEKFQVNIHSSLTIPALAMRIFKTHYMPKNKIGQILGKVEQAIRESYSGGAVDVYIPSNRITPWISNIVPKYKKIILL
jgi:hypothetical protein